MQGLIADDSGVICTVVNRAFQDLGIQTVHQARDGIDALKFLAANDYDIIVTDWNMPGATGLDVTKRARENGTKCPIIMQTTESEKCFVMQAIAAGVNDYVLKPFTKDEILEKIEMHLGANAT